MIRKVYSVRDLKAREYLGLVLFRNNAEAERFFLLTITDTRGSMWKFPRDYAIHEVGTFDVETGIIERTAVPLDVTPFSQVDMFVSRFNHGAPEESNGQAGVGSSRAVVSGPGGNGSAAG